MPIEHVQQYRRIYGQSLHMIMMKWGGREGLCEGGSGYEREEEDEEEDDSKKGPKEGLKFLKNEKKTGVEGIIDF